MAHDPLTMTPPPVPDIIDVPDDVSAVLNELDTNLIRRSPGVDLRLLVGQLPLTQASLAAALSDQDPAMRLQLIRNPWCPTAVLEQLRSDPALQVSIAARVQLALRHGIRPGDLDPPATVAAVVDRALRIPDRARLEPTYLGGPGFHALLRHTWGFTVDDVERLLSSCGERFPAHLAADVLAANPSLPYDAVELVAASEASRSGVWLRSPTTPGARLEEFAAAGAYVQREDRLLAHPSCTVSVASYVCSQIELSRFVFSNRQWDAAVIDDTANRIVRLAADPSLGTGGMVRLLEWLRRNPTAPPVLFTVAFDRIRNTTRLVSRALNSVRGDLRVPVELYEEQPVRQSDARATLIVLARMCSGRPDAADLLLGAAAITAHGNVTFREAVEVAAAVVS